MKKTYSWKKRSLSGTYTIFTEGIQAGELKDNSVRRPARAYFAGKNYSFKTKGVLKSTTFIYDEDLQQSIGEISYNSWGSRGEINIEGRTSKWKNINSFGTKWLISSPGGDSVSFSGSTSSGTAESDTTDDLLFLGGLYIKHYLSQLTVSIMITVFIPMILVLFIL